MKLTFDDVLLAPQFSDITSRRDVDVSSRLAGYGSVLDLKFPIISANMDTITEPAMAIAMAKYGGIGCLHRFSTIDNNVRQFIAVGKSPVIVSVGLGDDELVRAKSLYEEGANTFCLDVAHGAQMSVVKQYAKLKEMLPNSFVIVGNFGTAKSAKIFASELGTDPDAIKVGIGPGSACTTRVKTGCGYPQLSAIMECALLPFPIIADGGCRTPGDVVKALAAGASAVMLGGMLAGTYETPGDTLDDKGFKVARGFENNGYHNNCYKKYRGSASQESYDIQGKDQAYITPEGESFMVPYKGPVSEVLADIEGGLRSAMSYVGAQTLRDLYQRAEFIEISTGTKVENGAHGKR